MRLFRFNRSDIYSLKDKEIQKYIENFDILEIYNLFFNFSNKSELKLNFNIFNRIFYFSAIKLDSFFIFETIYTELRKRKFYFRFKDFIFLYIYNCSFLSLYIKKNNHINENFLNDSTIEYNKNFKSTKLGYIKCFNFLDVKKTFEIVFDKLILKSAYINETIYEKHMLSLRKDYFKCESIDYINKKTIKKIYNEIKNRKLYNFKIKKKLDFRKIIVYIGDLSIKEFHYLIKIVLLLIKNRTIILKKMKILDEFNITKTDHLHIFLQSSKNHININKWVKNNRFIFTIDDIENDLRYFLQKNIEEFLLKYNFISDKSPNIIRQIYNKNYFIKKRVLILLNMVTKEDFINDKE